MKRITDIDQTTVNPDTFVCRFIGKSGAVITVDRYGKDDFSVWITDDITNENHGCSTRGTFMDIIEELKGEI